VLRAKKLRAMLALDVPLMKQLPRPIPKAGGSREFVRSFATREEALHPLPLKKGVFGNKGSDEDEPEKLPTKKPSSPPKPAPPAPVPRPLPVPRPAPTPVTQPAPVTQTVTQPVTQAVTQPRLAPKPSVESKNMAILQSLQANSHAHSAALMRIELVSDFFRKAQNCLWHCLCHCDAKKKLFLGSNATEPPIGRAAACGIGLGG
jgi:hypothetical protein